MESKFLKSVSTVKPLFEYLQKQQENRKFQKTIEFSATFVLITFFMFFAVRPTLLTISSLKGEIESKKILKSSLKKKINDIIEAQDKFSQVQEKYYIVNMSLPDTARYYDAATQLQQSGARNSIPIDKLTYNLGGNQNSKMDPSLHLYQISVDVDGPFVNSLKLASEMLGNRRLININSISFEAASVGSDESTESAKRGVSTHFSSQFYYWPQ